MAQPHRTAAGAAGVVAAVSMGEGVLEAVSGDFVGRVEGVFDTGFYVSAPSQAVFAVLGPRGWAGPLHLVVEALDALPARHAEVTVAGGVLDAGPVRVRVDSERRWAPGLPERLSVAPAIWRGIAGPAESELVPVWEEVTGDVRRGDLAAVFGRLQGRGTGLTPSGDDVLAGILLVCAMTPSSRESLARLARSARTSTLSRAYLRWAAAGQSIQPAHSLLDAAAAGDQDAMRAAAKSLSEVGATSGRALVAGLALAATELAPTMASPSSAV